MKTTKNIARLAVTAGLTAALSFGGVMAPVTMAFAAEGGTAASHVPTATTTGNVTIAENTYAGTSFKGIQIFRATVTQGKADTNGDGVADANGAWNKDGEKTLSDIQWATPEVEKAVKGVFAKDTNPGDSATAQDWADYINRIVAGNAGEGFKVDADSALDKIAKELEKVNTTDETAGWKASTDGKFSTLSAGYWLFVTAGVSGTANTTKGNMDAYTSPIFAIVGGEDVNVKPKKDVPNVTKAVKDDATGATFGTDVFTSPNKSADSRMDQFIEYQLTGTVASNINTYSTYKYIFTDKLPTSMTPELKNDNATPVVTVKIDDNVVKSGYEPTYSGDVLTVNFTNLKACQDENDKPIVLNDKSKVTVEYKAKLDSAKIFVNGKDGAIKPEFGSLVGEAQENTVTLTYSNNPHAEGTGATGTTVKHPAYDYTYGIDVTKVGSETDNPPLAGVVFTLQERGDADGTFIMANGTKTTDSKLAELTTDASGKINVVGLDEGTYILKEVTPAPGYNNSAANGVTFTIKSTFDQTGKNVNLDTSTIDAGNDVVKGGTATAEAGKLSFTIIDKKGSNLPLTGLNGVTFTWIAGGAVLCIGVAHLIRSRKRDEGSEE